MTEKLAQPILDLRKTTNHPLSLRYSEVYSYALLEGEFEHGRAQPGLPLSGKTPFVDIARIAVTYGVECPDTLDMMQARLRSFYEQVRPINAAQWLGLARITQLSKTPPWGAVFPWRARTVESYQKAYEDAAWAENRAVGRDVGISDGWLFCGPVSDEKVRIEAERILYVVRCIQAKGYKRSDEPDGDVKATALVTENQDWRWIVTAGNHRASAAVALGLRSIPVRINLVISRADAAYWKHVVDGLFTTEEALNVFDNFFYGRSVNIVRPWLSG